MPTATTTAAAAVATTTGRLCEGKEFNKQKDRNELYEWVYKSSRGDIKIFNDGKDRCTNLHRVADLHKS